MQRPRDLIVTNVAVLLVLLVVLLVGWREAAAFGLAVLVILDLMVVIREHSGRPKEDKKE
jgi:hypothetical protein